MLGSLSYNQKMNPDFLSNFFHTGLFIPGFLILISMLQYVYNIIVIIINYFLVDIIIKNIHFNTYKSLYALQYNDDAVVIPQPNHIPMTHARTLGTMNREGIFPLGLFFFVIQVASCTPVFVSTTVCIDKGVELTAGDYEGPPSILLRTTLQRSLFIITNILTNSFFGHK